jgi:hypothetical protein
MAFYEALAPIFMITKMVRAVFDFPKEDQGCAPDHEKGQVLDEHGGARLWTLRCIPSAVNAADEVMLGYFGISQIDPLQDEGIPIGLRQHLALHS